MPSPATGLDDHGRGVFIKQTPHPPLDAEGELSRNPNRNPNRNRNRGRGVRVSKTWFQPSFPFVLVF